MKRALIICRLDAYANAVKPEQLRQFLEGLGCQVDFYSTEHLGRLGTGRLTRLLPGRRALQFRLYLLEGLQSVAFRSRRELVIKTVLTLTAKRVLNLRGRLLTRVLPRGRYDLLICESNDDEAFTLHDRVAAVQILDLPVPLAEEIYYGGRLAHRQFRSLRRFEAEVYAKADYLSFHWHTYSSFVKRTKYSGPNFLDMTYGTTPKPVRASYSARPRVVFLGSLEGYWVNIPLLERLTRLFPDIDVYGGPPPPSSLSINYRGYAETLDVLADYQFGLITISDDELRRNSFSSKHLEYFSYGLPVLTPEWRVDSTLDPASLLYNESTFAALITQFTVRESWEELSQKALATAAALTWPAALESLRPIVEGHD